jgi:hypothetical protein
MTILERRRVGSNLPSASTVTPPMIPQLRNNSLTARTSRWACLIPSTVSADELVVPSWLALDTVTILRRRACQVIAVAQIAPNAIAINALKGIIEANATDMTAIAITNSDALVRKLADSSWGIGSVRHSIVHVDPSKPYMVITYYYRPTSFRSASSSIPHLLAAESWSRIDLPSTPRVRSAATTCGSLRRSLR